MSVDVNTLLVIAGVIVAGIIAKVAMVSNEVDTPQLPPGRKPAGKKTSGKHPIVAFTYALVPRYVRKGDQMVVLTRKGVPLTRKIVKETPSELTAAAGRALGRGVVLDDFILATIIASEADAAYTPYMRAAIGNTVMNHQKAGGHSLFEILKSPDGVFADQLGGNYVSTANAPTEEDLLLAEAVRDGRLPDTTGGAIEFDSPRAQRALVNQGIYSADNGPEAVAARRMKGGKVPFYLPNVNPDEIRFWVKKKAA